MFGRVLKFRAWDKANRRWIYGLLDGPHFDLSLHADCVPREDEPEFRLGKRIVLSPWAQYIGTEDSRHNEMCEGDIVSGQGNLNGTMGHFIGIITHVAADAVMKSEFKIVNIADQTWVTHVLLRDCTVIGNLMENPELINQNPGMPRFAGDQRSKKKDEWVAAG